MPDRNQLYAKITFTVDRVRRNNGIIETLFTRRPDNGKTSQDEHGLFNTLIDRGEPELGERYVITIRPESPKR